MQAYPKNDRGNFYSPFFSGVYSEGISDPAN